LIIDSREKVVWKFVHYWWKCGTHILYTQSNGQFDFFGMAIVLAVYVFSMSTRPEIAATIDGFDFYRIEFSYEATYTSFQYSQP